MKEKLSAGLSDATMPSTRARSSRTFSTMSWRAPSCTATSRNVPANPREAPAPAVIEVMAANDATAAEVPVLPVRSGAVMRNQEAVIGDLLRDNHDEFAAALREPGAPSPARAVRAVCLRGRGLISR